ncbi:MAG: hypothetical protein RR483_05460 [Clostridia bacterium]
MNSIIKKLIALICFILFMGLIIYGQSNKGIEGLGIMLIGLAGLLVMLYLYNRQFTKDDKKIKIAEKAADKAEKALGTQKR